MRVNFDIIMDEYKAFQRNCKKKGRSMSDVLRMLMVGWNAKVRREEMKILRAKEVEEVNDGQADRTG